MEDIRTGTYIEYVGELGLESCDFRWPLREFVHRNYKFSMNEVKDRDDLSLYSDSARAGNETRYINHPVTRADMNVNASLFLVNGEFRMGIWSLTGIPKGDELFLDYGKDYFPEDSETEEIPVASKRGGRPRKN
ncbi:hypothetical protein OF83DRAFT_631933 [Amylostereum chailletii]|nr:hypothetical protein OF83DRAFT_631933 [Amylostereum chailletii]